MYKSNRDDIGEVRQLRSHKSPSSLTYKSQKALKLLSGDTQNSKPFRRKQQNIVSGPKFNKNNFYPQDVGKLIVNTSFGSNPDLQKILSTSPKNFQSSDNCEGANCQTKETNKINHLKLIRENKSMSNFEKMAEATRLLSPRARPSVQNVIKSSEQIPSHESNQFSIERIEKLKLEKSELQQKLREATLKLQQAQYQLQQKQQIIASNNIELLSKIEELKKEKQMNKCLEEIIIELNSKIADLICTKQNEFREKTQIDSTEGQEKNIAILKEEELKKEIDYLGEKVYGLNRAISGYQIENLTLKKLKHELEKQRITLKCLQKENKCLKQRILNMIKNSKFKQQKLSLRKELDYSISFDFEG